MHTAAAAPTTGAPTREGTPPLLCAVPEPAPVLVITAPTGELHVTGPTHQEAPGRLDALVKEKEELQEVKKAALAAAKKVEEKAEEKPGNGAFLWRGGERARSRK